jgi:purine-binding chemotaxis protein CheW
MRERTLDMPTPANGRVAEIRDAFDRSFAAAPAAAAAEPVSLLAVRAGEHPFAVRLSETAGLITDRRVTPVPTAMPELVGIAGVRGVAIPVYDLAMMLGFPAMGAARWLLLARGAAIAFALDSFDGQLRVDAKAIASNDAAAGAYVREVVSAADGSRPIVDIAAVVAAIRERTTGFARSGEA